MSANHPPQVFCIHGQFTVEAEIYNPRITCHEPSVVIARVSVLMRIPVDDICGDSRTQHIVTARMMAIYACRELTSYSFPAIGKFFHKNHSTMIHAYQLIKRRTLDPAFGLTVKTLLAQIEAGHPAVVREADEDLARLFPGRGPKP